MYYILFIPLVLSLIAGLVFFKNIKPVFLSPVVLVLAVTILNEIIVYYLYADHSTRKYVNYAYNVFSLIDMSIWLYTFYRINTSSMIKKVIAILGVLLILTSLIEIEWCQHWKFLHTNTMRIYSLSLIGLSIIYLNSLLALDYHEMQWNPYFYICSACIIYQSVLFGNLTILAENQNTHLANMHGIFAILQEIANCLYYLVLCASFVVCYLTRRRRVPTSTPGSSFSMAF